MEENQEQVPLYDVPKQEEKVMSVGDWLVTLLLMVIPLVNLVLLFVWAFGSGNKNRSNWAKAELILLAIVIALYILFFVVFGFSLLAANNAF